MSSNNVVRLLPERVSALDAWIDGQTVEIVAPPRGVVKRVLAAKDQLVEKGALLLQLDHGVEVRAPVEGRLIRLEVLPGGAVDRSRPLVAILYSDDLWALAHFGPEQFARLRLGQHARVQTATHVLAGRVGGLISPRYPVLLDLVGGHHAALQPGMSAAVTVEVE